MEERDFITSFEKGRSSVKLNVGPGDWHTFWSKLLSSFEKGKSSVKVDVMPVCQRSLFTKKQGTDYAILHHATPVRMGGGNLVVNLL